MTVAKAFQLNPAGNGGIFLLSFPSQIHGIVVPLSDNKNAFHAFVKERIHVYEKIHLNYPVGAVHLHELRHLRPKKKPRQER